MAHLSNVHSLTSPLGDESKNSKMGDIFLNCDTYTCFKCPSKSFLAAISFNNEMIVCDSIHFMSQCNSSNKNVFKKMFERET